MMNRHVYDSNGNRLYRNVRRAVTADGTEGWGVTVWSGGINGLGTSVRRLVFETREQARKADISDYGPGYLGMAVTDLK